MCCQHLTDCASIITLLCLGTTDQSGMSVCATQIAVVSAAVCRLVLAGVNVARMLIDRGDLVLIADSQGIRDIYSADGNSIDNSTPLVVLVNKGTASASEVRQCGRHIILLFFGAGRQTLASKLIKE
jgi:hypothetical protein